MKKVLLNDRSRVEHSGEIKDRNSCWIVFEGSTLIFINNFFQVIF